MTEEKKESGKLEITEGIDTRGKVTFLTPAQTDAIWRKVVSQRLVAEAADELVTYNDALGGKAPSAQQVTELGRLSEALRDALRKWKQ